uniref:ribonuclease E inhibitor RraB n=1 Tax=uncultured Sphingomonas sp. TaxID=158754 RepID=UPI0035C9F916
MDLLRENAGVLRSLGYSPDEQLTPCRVDFSLVFPNDEICSRSLSVLSDLGFACQMVDDGVDSTMSELVAYQVIAPTAEAITEAELALDECLRPFGARTDGWGFFRDSVH